MPRSKLLAVSSARLCIVFFVFQFPVPAGLVIYWATTNLWTAGQQLVRTTVATGLADRAAANGYDGILARTAATAIVSSSSRLEYAPRCRRCANAFVRLASAHRFDGLW